MNINSLEAYKNLIDSGGINRREIQVLAYVKQFAGKIIDDCCRYYGLKRNQIAPRYTGLKDKGLIREIGKSVKVGRYDHAKYAVTGNTTVIEPPPKPGMDTATLLKFYRENVITDYTSNDIRTNNLSTAWITKELLRRCK